MVCADPVPSIAPRLKCVPLVTYSAQTALALPTPVRLASVRIWWRVRKRLHQSWTQWMCTTSAAQTARLVQPNSVTAQLRPAVSSQATSSVLTPLASQMHMSVSSLQPLIN